MLPDLQTIIITYLPWEEYSDILLPLYPFAKKQWILVTKFTTITTKNLTTYHVNDVLHRTDGPARISIIDNARIEQYYYQGLLHRTDGPAHISILDNARVEQYYYQGELHRTDGPAHIYTINGNKVEEYYYQLNRL
jgi:hypothetical protein